MTLEKRNRRFAGWMIALGLLSLALRFFVIFHDGNQLWLQSDDAVYMHSAAHLLQRGIFTYAYPHLPTVFIPPGYPVLVMILFFLFGTGAKGLLVVRLAGAFLSLLTVLLLMFWARTALNERTALIAGALWALYPPAILMSGMLLTETLFTFLLLLFFYLFYRYIDQPALSRAAWSGSILGLATLVRPTIFLLPVALSLYLVWKKGLKTSVLGISVLYMTALIVLSPWILRNYYDFHRFIPLTVASGNPFLTGTYYECNIWMDGRDQEFPDWPAGWKKVPGDEQATDARLREFGHQRLQRLWKTEPRKVAAWYLLGKPRYMWENVALWEAVKIPCLPIPPIRTAHLCLLLLSVLGGLWALCKGRHGVLPVLLLLLYFTLVGQVFTPLPRYVFPVLPLFFALGAFFLSQAAGLLQRGE